MILSLKKIPVQKAYTLATIIALHVFEKWESIDPCFVIEYVF